MDFLIREIFTFIIHSHIDTNITMNTIHNKSFFEILMPLQELIEMAACGWHNNS